LPELVFRQEYLAEFVQEIDGALWSREWFERPGFYLDKPRSYRRIVVGVDPNASNTETSDEMGIIVRGLTHDNHIDLLADYTLRGTVRQRAAAVVRAFHDWNADCVVLEVNNGGDWIPAAIEHIDPQVAAACRTVHATRGKLTRAEPDASKCEKGEVHHVGRFPELENELTTWVPGMPSPNRLDAYVWAGWELMKRPGLTTDEQYQFAMV
jgi:phage terminase large subunit-like protein